MSLLVFLRCFALPLGFRKAAVFTLVVFAAAFNVVSQTPGTNLWEYTLPEKVYASPALGADGTVYVPCMETSAGAGSLHAFSADGQRLWYAYTGGGIKQSSPAVGLDGTIYVGTIRGLLFAFSPSGKTNWMFRTGVVRPISTPAVGADGTIYVTGNGSWNFQLYSITAQGGTNWTAVLSSAADDGGTHLPSPVIAPDRNIYVVSGRSNLMCLTPEGRTNWMLKLSANSFSSPAIGPDGTLFFGAEDNSVYSISHQGRLKWRHRISAPSFAFVESSPALDGNGCLYVGMYSPNGGLVALSPAGEQRWLANLGYGISSSPALDAAGNIYFTELTSGRLRAMDQSGSNIWSFSIGSDPSFSSPVISPDGVIYVANGKKLFAIYGGSPPLRSAWPMFRGGPRHTARALQRGIQCGRPQSNGTISLAVFTELGLTYCVQTSSNTLDWVEASTYTSTNWSTTITLPREAGPQHFFRLRLETE